jgi:archaeosortase A (PGF-CTERM-specific)
MDQLSQQSSHDAPLLLFFFLVPTIMLIAGYFFVPYPQPTAIKQLLVIPLFLGLIFLGIGFFWRRQKTAGIFKIFGWIAFAFFWATQPAFLYFSEAGDVFNAAVCIAGVYVLIYIGYHELLSLRRTDEHFSCLNWIAGGTFFAGIIYFSIDSVLFPQLKYGLIEIVAAHSTDLLRFVGLDAIRQDHVIIFNETPITIIFACTAIQAMVLFVGMISALNTISVRRKLLGIVVTVIPIYFLNLVRNASVIFLVGSDITSFSMAHNVLAKAGALITLIVLLFIVFKLIPQLYDEISCLFDLTKRKGPVELLFRGSLREK